ncbi:Polyhydroxyalkanoate depolymerase [Rhodovastum atsumiense]|uniref:Polyhydroxyalkanoate depolymerase n=1 Tax=Rhodovastum atsumiense TaxID=504468 RepID=A0A5M6J0Z4_9PROT|nr:polyhydroxyalkanoate depolymerase [Rhodovastum atsumiense]KAA5614266.1 polyhydroxyalkanoate depolymerase [Rhodovastum atsumiense]CAH2604720.1 Polyhydroxyalkanoate depolymerase [Rhodovastum atsumiense]
MLYHVYEMQRVTLAPMRMLANHALTLLDTPFNPWRPTMVGRLTHAALDSFEHSTRRFGKPEFGHKRTIINGEPVEITEEIVVTDPWCDLLRFRRAVERPHDPKLLIVAPMSGHYATLLRGTVKAFLPDHDVYITDWRDAREVPLAGPDFDLNDYIDYVIRYLHLLGRDTHVIAVCQPSVPVVAAISLMNEAKDPSAPQSVSLIGGPIDTRVGITSVNDFAKKHSIDWFRRHVIHRVPIGYPGSFRRVYPGFLQLAGFMAMNIDRHMEAHWQMFLHLVEGDGETLTSKRRFYEEYRAVMDMSADFYLQTIHSVFQEHLLPRGLLLYRGHRVDPSAIERTAIQTIEGERDDISGIGQTKATHTMTPNLASEMREHWEQPGVGHYGLFNGQRFRAEIAPRIKAFIRAHHDVAYRDRAA